MHCDRGTAKPRMPSGCDSMGACHGLELKSLPCTLTHPIPLSARLCLQSPL